MNANHQNNTWSAKTALTDQEKDCLTKIQTLFQKKQLAPEQPIADSAQQLKDKAITAEDQPEIKLKNLIQQASNQLNE